MIELSDGRHLHVTRGRAVVALFTESRSNSGAWMGDQQIAIPSEHLEQLIQELIGLNTLKTEELAG